MKYNRRLIAYNIVLLTLAALVCTTNGQSGWDAIQMIGAAYGVDFGSSPSCSHPSLVCQGNEIVEIHLDPSSSISTTSSISTGDSSATQTTTSGSTSSDPNNTGMTTQSTIDTGIGTSSSSGTTTSGTTSSGTIAISSGITVSPATSGTITASPTSGTGSSGTGSASTVTGNPFTSVTPSYTPSVTPYITPTDDSLAILGNDEVAELKIWPSPRGRRIYSVNLYNAVTASPYLKTLTISGRSQVDPDAFILNQITAQNLLNITIQAVNANGPVLTVDIASAFPSLLNLKLTGNAVGGEVPTSLFAHPKLQTLTLRGTSMLIDSLNEFSGNNSLLSLVIEATSTQSGYIAFRSTAFPVLTDLSFFCSNTFIVGFYVSTLERLIISGVGSNVPITLSDGPQFPALTNIYIENASITSIPSNFFENALNIVSIGAKNVNYQYTSQPLFTQLTNLLNLNSYLEDGTSLAALPATINFPASLKSLTLKNLASLNANIDSATYASLDRFDASNNPNLKFASGIPQQLCSVSYMDLKGTAVNTATGCFACFKDYTAKWFNTGTQFTASNCGVITNQPANGYTAANGGQIIIRGTNLGWAFGATTGVSLDYPNTQLIYRVPNFSPIPNGIIPTTINLGNGKQASFNYTIVTPVVTKVLFNQNDFQIDLTIMGRNFDSDTSFFIGGFYCYGYYMTPNTQYLCSVDSLEQGKVQITAASSLYGNSTFTANYVQDYPTVTSVSPIGESGGILTIFGFFGFNPSTTKYPVPTTTTTIYVDRLPASRGLMSVTGGTVSILIDNVECLNITASELILTCEYAPTGPGRKKLTVLVNDFKFESSNLLYVTPSKVACPGGCGDGACNNGICVCPVGFSGPSCNFKLPSEDQPQPNIITATTAPASTYSLMGVEYTFNMVSIQEVDDAQNVVSETLLGGWDYSQSSTDEYDASIYKSIAQNANVTAVIEINKAHREIEFAGITSTYEANSLKASVTIVGWSFQSSLNHLRAVFSTQFVADDTQSCGTSSSNQASGDDTLKYLSIERNGVIFYGRFLDLSLSDGRPAFSATEIVNQTDSAIYLAVSVPKCTECILDPDFSMLIQPDKKAGGCSDDKKAWVIPVAVVIPVVVVSAGVAAAVIVIRKKLYVSRRGFKFSFSRRGFGSSRNLSMKNM